MIELLFRAHITDTGELIYSRTVQDKYKFTMYFAEGLVIEKLSTHPRGWEYIDATIQQFTGLYDKNGKAIYDGDIIKVFVKELDKYLIGKILYKRSGRYIDDMYLWEYSNDCEIMGNIYQNPELLNTSTS